MHSVLLLTIQCPSGVDLYRLRTASELDQLLKKRRRKATSRKVENVEEVRHCVSAW